MGPPKPPPRPSTSPSPSPPGSPAGRIEIPGPSGKPIVIRLPRTSIQPRKREAKEVWNFKGASDQDLRAWILACEDHFGRNPWMWESDKDRIKYAISCLEDKAKPFGERYRKRMDGKDGEIMQVHFRYWTTFVTEMKARFLSSEEAREARNKMDHVKYNNSIDDYMLQQETLNAIVRMSGVAYRTCLEKSLPQAIRHRLSYFESPDSDEDWARMVTKVGKMEESFRAEQKLLHPTEEKKGERKKATATGASTSNRRSNPDNTQPKRNRDQPILHTNRDDALKGIPSETLKERSGKGLCVRCGKGRHIWAQCRYTNPVVSAVGGKRKDRDTSEEPPVKAEKKAKVEVKEKKVAGLKTSGGRIWEITSDDEIMGED
jgi:hypothetical protein